MPAWSRPPGSTGRSYQLTALEPDAPYIDPERWQREAPLSEGSWWPAWEAWLAQRAGPLLDTSAPAPGLERAPGRYVLEP